MKHRSKKIKIGSSKSHTKLMLANQASSLIRNEYIVTTVAKAKKCKGYVDKVISTAKRKGVSSKRRVHMLLNDKKATDKIFDVLLDKYKDRTGGFVQIHKLSRRKGDDAPLAKLNLVGYEPVRKKKKVRTRKKREAEKKDKGEDKEKSGVLDRVKKLGRGKGQEKKKKEDQTKGKEIRAKSRSGI